MFLQHSKITCGMQKVGYSEIRDPGREVNVMLQTSVPRVTQFISRPLYSLCQRVLKLLRNNIEKWLLASLCLCCLTVRNWTTIIGEIWWNSVFWASIEICQKIMGLVNIRRKWLTFHMDTYVFVWPLSPTVHHNWDRLWPAWGRSWGRRVIRNWDKLCSVWRMRAGWETTDSITCISTSLLNSLLRNFNDNR
jgi:hypothetical protein